MIDFYKELKIDRTWSLSEIQNYLDKNVSTWEGLAFSRGDDQSLKRLDYAKQSQDIFSNQQSRERYDKELDLFLNPPSQSDIRLRACKEDFQKAKEAYNRNDLNLAKIAIESALGHRNQGNTSPLRLAAAISLGLGEFSQAIAYINQAIMEKPEDGRNYYQKLDVLVQDVVSSSGQSYVNQAELARKKEVVFDYISQYFETDVAPKTEQEKACLYEEQLKQARILQSYLYKMQQLKIRVFRTYADMVLNLRNKQLYPYIYNAYQNYFASGYDYETSMELLDFSKRILRIDPQAKIAVNFIQRYDDIRRDEEQARIKEDNRKRREQEELQKNIQRKAELGEQIIGLKRSIKDEESNIDILSEERRKIRLLRTWTSYLWDNISIFVIVIYWLSVSVFILYFAITAKGYFDTNRAFKTAMILPIIVHLVIEGIVWMRNQSRKEEIARLESKIATLKSNIQYMETQCKELQRQFNSLSHIPYNGKDINYL